jgi:hypothetical protein
MSKLSIQAQDNVKVYLSEISEMKVSELEFFARELNALITRKRAKMPKYRISKLYRLIDETVLDADTQVIFDVLAEKLHAETMTEAENRVYLKIAEQEENIRNQRITYMVELSQLRQIPFPELMSELGLKPLPNV